MCNKEQVTCPVSPRAYESCHSEIHNCPRVRWLYSLRELKPPQLGWWQLVPRFVHLCLVRLLCCPEGALALFHLRLLQRMVGGLLQALISLRPVSISVSFGPGQLLRPIMVVFLELLPLSQSGGNQFVQGVSGVFFLGGLSWIGRRWQFVINGCSSQVQEVYVKVSLGSFRFEKSRFN